LATATATGAVDWAAPSEEDGEVASLTGAGRGVATEIVTWPRPVTTPDTVRLDCRFMTPTTSPSVPLSSDLPRAVI